MVYFPYFAQVEMLSSDVDLFYINFLLKTSFFKKLQKYSDTEE